MENVRDVSLIFTRVLNQRYKLVNNYQIFMFNIGVRQRKIMDTRFTRNTSNIRFSYGSQAKHTITFLQ